MRKTVLMLACGLATVAPLAHAADVFTWSHLADLPAPHGVAGCFAGVVASQAKTAGDEHLVVAGGANFPDGPPWADGGKAWQADSWSLSAPDAAWEAGPPLPRPLAYGVTLRPICELAEDMLPWSRLQRVLAPVRCPDA